MSVWVWMCRAKLLKKNKREKRTETKQNKNNNTTLLNWFYIWSEISNLQEPIVHKWLVLLLYCSRWNEWFGRNGVSSRNHNILTIKMWKIWLRCSFILSTIENSHKSNCIRVTYFTILIIKFTLTISIRMIHSFTYLYLYNFYIQNYDIRDKNNMIAITLPLHFTFN